MKGEHPLTPALPYDMAPRARAAAGDVRLRQFVERATTTRDRGRADACRAAFGDALDEVRSLAGQLRQHALDHLDTHLERFIEEAERGGITVHVAADGPAAVAICRDIAQRHGCRTCVKSKSMVTEEIGLLDGLMAAGVETVETDLGEFIVQLDGDAPSHIVAPMIHKDRTDVARAFQRELGAPYTEDPEALTRIARQHLRGVYRRADLGVSGANFLVAETGSIVLCTNEGNADFCVSGPPVHVAVAGIEKLIGRLADLSVYLKLLARSATSQPLTVYTTLIQGPRRPGERDGPREVHVILLDNGRSRLLAADTRELLRCIRCGACLNACPVYRQVGGGHAYGAVYSGPIGATITPLFKGIANYPDLPRASSLCGACHAACPVDIDLPHHLIALRRRQVRERVTGPGERLAYRVWAWWLRGARRYRVAGSCMRLLLRAMGRSMGQDAGAGGRRRWIARPLPGLRPWLEHRDFPAPPRRNFREWWRRRR
jgi:L-lactate dehydrogenase complex protein LldF